MKIWAKRPREEAYLLNPAFCCIVITSTHVGYCNTNDITFPFPLSFMVLPIILHKDTRMALPTNIRTSIPAWMQENATARILFYERLISLKPHTREAINHGLLYGWLAFAEGGALKPVVSNTIFNRTLRNLKGEARECVLRARFLGKWFASGQSVETTMALWGIRP